MRGWGKYQGQEVVDEFKNTKLDISGSNYPLCPSLSLSNFLISVNLGGWGHLNVIYLRVRLKMKPFAYKSLIYFNTFCPVMTRHGAK